MNIFKISEELQSIFDTLEENGGELTKELEDKLAITKEDFRNKVESYANVIKSFDYDVKACDEEIKRLQAYKKSKQATSSRLKNIVIWAIEQFGDTSKTGSKFIDLGTSKLSVRNSEVVKVNEERYEDEVSSMDELLRGLAFTNELSFNSIKDILNLKEDNLKGIVANISVDVPLTDICQKDGDKFIKSIFEYGRQFKFKPNINKIELKDTLKSDPDAYPGLATLEINKTLTIK